MGLRKRRYDPADEAMDASMFSYVVRIWKEELTSEKRQTVWRGHITAIPNGKRHYFSDISEIPALIAAHLEKQL